MAGQAQGCRRSAACGTHGWQASTGRSMPAAASTPLQFQSTSAPVPVTATLTRAGKRVPESSSLSAPRTAASPSVMRSAAASITSVACRRSSSAQQAEPWVDLPWHGAAAPGCGCVGKQAPRAASSHIHKLAFELSPFMHLGAPPAAGPAPAAHPCARARCSARTAPAAPEVGRAGRCGRAVTHRPAGRRTPDGGSTAAPWLSCCGGGGGRSGCPAKQLNQGMTVATLQRLP